MADVAKPLELAPEEKPPTEEPSSEPVTSPPAGIVPLTEEPKPQAEAPPTKPASEEDKPKVEETVTAAPVTKPAESSSSNGPTWQPINDDHPISLLLKQLPAILKETSYAEVYGITLDPSGPFHTKLILQKFLRGNANDVDKAATQLKNTLKWRKEFQPLKALEETFSKERFGGLGYVVELTDVPGSENKKDIATFNIYGAVKDNKKTFGDIDAFLRWRVALMELGIQKLALLTVTTPIPDFGSGPDPHQGIQIHDYLQVSFLRQDPHVKAASKAAIDTFSAYYPETLSRKIFVSVPLLMQWMFTAMKVLLSRETVKKFSVLSYANQLHTALGGSVPKGYGGSGGSLEEVGETVKLE
ncbi:CRAL/TRIO domain-containing protein [Tothia fuscella]|uniref:Phosphatidylinositol transfer protein SFH5 n=1 Tax=Tothia fuscella TaxID=1048955 RepID=A0A9P4TTC8_9PEZI|nr:CRAL/TRIO domain-containing protein [Tothia fuscella]